MNNKNKLAPIFPILILIFTLAILIIKTSAPATAQTPGLDDLVDVINTIDPGETSTHAITFTLPPASQQINPSDYIRFRLDHYSDITAPSSITGTYTGSPSAQIVGNNLYISNITVAPGSEITFSGLTTKNPPQVAYLSNFYIIIYITEDFAGTIVKNYASVVPTLHQGEIDVSAYVTNPTAELQISGLAAPYTYVLFNDGLTIMGTAYTGQDGYFSKVFGLPGGTHNLSFYGIDFEDRNTSAISIEIDLPVYELTTLTDQLLSPTIQVDDVSILPGEAIYATGSAAPNTTINIFTDSPLRSYTTTASSSGAWSYTITDSENYSPGDYSLYAMAQTGTGLQSIFGPAVTFTINGTAGAGGTACGDISEGDLNCDTDINLIDFSILMYYWGTDSEAADINQSGLVDLTDFSIMMYYWGS